MSGVQNLRFVRRASTRLGHLVLEFGETDCGALTWALRTEHGSTAVASGFLDEEGRFSLELETASRAARRFQEASSEEGCLR